MQTTKLRLIAIIAAFIATLIYGAYATDAASSFSTFNLFSIGGAGITQVIPLSPLWSVNVPLSPPTAFTAASSTQGGSLTAGSKLWFEITASNGTGTTTVSSEIATTTNAASLQTNLTWTAVPGATKYFVNFSTTTAGAENAYFVATTTNAYNFTSTSSPIGFGRPPGFPSSFAVQIGNSANPLVVNGVTPITTASIGGSSITAGGCNYATSTLAAGSVSSSTAFITTPKTDPGPSVVWESYAANATQVVTKLCALITVTPVAAVYTIKAI
jgi:hypothetical protein